MPAVSRRHRTWSVLVVGATVSFALVLAGCGTAGSNTSKSQPLPGVTAKTVDLGFSLVDLGALAKALGFKQPDYGGFDLESKAINGIVDSINKNGGMGGRQVKVTIKRYLGATDSPDQSEAQCKGFTQDDKVMAAILDGGFQNNTIPCFAGANTLILMQSLLALDQTSFEQNSPYLWSPTHPEYSGFVQAQLAAMKAAKFFDGNTGVLVAPSDDEVSRRTTNTVVEPYLKSIGVTKMQTSYIDSTNTGTLGASSSAALVAGKNGGLNRVIVIGGARIEPVILSDQNASDYPSTWGVSTYDNPVFTENNPESIVTSLRNGMTGIGYAPAQDVNQQQAPAWPDPTNAAQKQCVDVVNAAGATPPGNLRNNWKNDLLYCDAAYFLKAALDQLPGKSSITGAEFKDAVAKIGSTYHSSMAFSSQWGPGVYAGTNAAKSLSWLPSCSCFAYSGNVITFPTTGAGSASGTANGTADTSGSVPLQTITVSP